MVGCAAPQHVTVGEAYRIPQPHHALLQTHEKPKCEFGAPRELPVAAKVEDTWTPYSGRFENEPVKEADAETEKEPENGSVKAADAQPEKEPENGPVNEASAETKKEPENEAVKEADAQPAPETAEPAEHYALLSKERNCYQDAEVTVRNKLHKLQSSVGNTLIALQKETTVRVNAQEQGSTP